MRLTVGPAGCGSCEVGSYAKLSWLTTAGTTRGLSNLEGACFAVQ
jgi:hypothetical protein